MNNKSNRRPVKRGDIYYADLPSEEIGSVQAGYRPVLITQANFLNRNSTTVIVAVITSKIKRPSDEVHVVLPKVKGLPLQSMVVAEQRKTISKEQLVEYRGHLDDETMKEVTRALRVAEKPDKEGGFRYGHSNQRCKSKNRTNAKKKEETYTCVKSEVRRRNDG